MVAGQPTETGPEHLFSISFTARDYFGTIANLEGAVDAVAFQFYVASVSSDGYANRLDGVDNVPLSAGDASFTDLRLRGAVFDVFYTLVIYSTPPTTVLNHDILLRPCGPGYEPVFIAGIWSCQRCIPGRFNLDGGVCRVCPFGAQCLGGDEILAEVGFWRDPATGVSPVFHKCALSGACCPEGNCALNQECTANRVGPLCGGCADNYWLWGQDCRICHRTSVVPALPSVALVIGLVLYSLNKVPTTDGFFKIVAYNFQVSVLFPFSCPFDLVMGWDFGSLPLVVPMGVECGRLVVGLTRFPSFFATHRFAAARCCRCWSVP